LRKKLSLYIILLIICSFSLSAEAPRFIVNSGHSDSVSSLDYSLKDNLLFSSGNDGTVKIWNPDNGKMEFQFQISHMPVRSVTACGSKPYFAAVESDGINAVNLSVWNWETGERMFKQRLSEVPLFIKFSPKGNFIVYGKTDWNSLVFIDAETGKLLPYLQEGFGIVSAAFVSESEKTILTYSNSGYIQYWDLNTGTRKTRIPTFANLEDISFVSSGRYMTAYNGRELLLIDLIRGTKIDSLSSPNLVISTIDDKNDNLVFITENGRDMSYNTLPLSGAAFGSLIETINRNTEDLPSFLISLNGKVLTGYNSGEIYSKDRYAEDIKVFSTNNLLDVNDFAISSNSIAITAPGKLVSISSDFFTKDDTGSLDTAVDSKVITLDESSIFGISPADDDNFLLWHSESSQGGSVRVYNGRDGFTRELSQSAAPLLSAEYKNGRLLTLNKNGDCRIIDYETGEQKFNYSSYGLRTVDFIDRNNIIAGRNSSSTLPSPLLHINTATGETVPIDNSNMLIFNLKYDELTRKLYTLGFEERNGIMRTVLKEHTGRNHDRAETIMAFPGEDIDASFASDQNSSKIFTSLGYGGVKMLYWGGFTSLENSFSIPRDLKLRGNILISLNQDSSFTIWNPSTGQRVMDLYIFKDLSWAALLSEDKYYASPGAEKYINIYSGNSTRELRKTKYRIKTTG